MNYNDDVEIKNFITHFLTEDIIEKFFIKSVEKTNVCYRGKGLLAPYIEFFVKGSIEDNDKKMLEDSFTSAFQKCFNTDIIPGINFHNSALWVREYNGRFFHLCVANDSKDRNFVDYILFEVNKDDYQAILSSKYAYCSSEYDEKCIRRFTIEDEEEYKEIYKNGFTEALLRVVL